jgi:hypothetical protein
MTLLEKEAPANFVPAAAVIRKGQVLFEIIGRKGYVGVLLNSLLKPLAQLRYGI